MNDVVLFLIVIVGVFVLLALLFVLFYRITTHDDNDPKPQPPVKTSGPVLRDTTPQAYSDEDTTPQEYGDETPIPVTGELPGHFHPEPLPPETHAEKDSNPCEERGYGNE